MTVSALRRVELYPINPTRHTFPAVGPRPPGMSTAYLEGQQRRLTPEHTLLPAGVVCGLQPKGTSTPDVHSLSTLMPDPTDCTLCVNAQNVSEVNGMHIQAMSQLTSFLPISCDLILWLCIHNIIFILSYSYITYHYEVILHPLYTMSAIHPPT